MDARPGLVLAIGMDVSCSDGRVGRLERVLFDPSTHRLVFLVVAAGTFQHEDMLVALAQVDSAKGHSILLNLTRAQFAQLCDCVSAGELEPVPARSRRGEVCAVGPAQAVERGTRVQCVDGLAGRVEAVRLDPVSGEVQGLVVREPGLFAANRIVPAAWIVMASPAQVILDVPLAVVRSQPEQRTDLQILEDVRAALEADDQIRSLGLDRIDVVVANGLVTARGRVPTHLIADRIRDCVGRVRGVLAVDAGLTADDDLEVAVAGAIAHEQSIGSARLRIRARQGRVYVDGDFLSPDARLAALRAAETVPGVLAAVDAHDLVPES
jgi:osmotically-inducible protein OsmY